MRMESINFHDFMNDDYQTKRLDFKMPVMTITTFSPASLLNPPPLIAKAYLIMFCLGALLITAALMENVLADKGFFKIAHTIFDVIKLIMPFALIGALVLFVYMNPLL